MRWEGSPVNTGYLRTKSKQSIANDCVLAPVPQPKIIKNFKFISHEMNTTKNFLIFS